MSDLVELRDHRRPCEHGYTICHAVPDNGSSGSQLVAYTLGDCPGGARVLARPVDWCSIHNSPFAGEDGKCHWRWNYPPSFSGCVRSTVLIIEDVSSGSGDVKTGGENSHCATCRGMGKIPKRVRGRRVYGGGPCPDCGGTR